MKVKQIIEKKEKELEKFIEDSKNQLTKNSFSLATKETNNHREIRKLKKDIARAQTVKRERELLAAEESLEETK